MVNKEENQNLFKHSYDAYFKFNLEQRALAEAYIHKVLPQGLLNISGFLKWSSNPVSILIMGLEN